MTTQAAESTGLVSRTLHPAITTDAGSFEAAARAAERVTVCLERPGPEFRNRLMAFVLSSIERQLETLGAAPSGCTARDSLETILSDQLYRSRLLGAGGIALRFAALDGIADATEGLSVEDSHALRRMFALAELEPLQVFLPEPSARLGVLGAPQRLSDWLPIASTEGRVASIEYEAVAPEPGGAVDAPATPPGLAPPRLEEFVSAGESAPASPPAPASEGSRSESLLVAPCQKPLATPLEEAKPLAEKAGLDEHERPTVVPGLSPGDPVAAAAPATAAAAAPPVPAPPVVDASSELDEQHQRRCAAWLAQLQSMNGPKVHASVERAFLTAYLPLAREVASGKASREIRGAVESWAEGFAQSYAAAFKALSSHARRPTMVRDIFDVGQRWLNQYRAHSCQLLLVDGMRFDLGQRLNEEIERRITGQAVCRDQALLWAALPSNSGAQRLGDAGAKRAPPSNARIALDAGSASSAVESLRIGSRELFRIDRLSADLTRPGEQEPQRLERLAILLADALVPWLKARGPDALIVVFGDHGFHWQAGERGTSAAQRGGALPEQVLVPASAWLLGGTRPKAGLAPGVH